MFFDPRYLIFALPALLLAFYAQWRVKSAYQRYSRKPNARGISGNEAARILLRSTGQDHIRIEQAKGQLSDHYDPSKDILRLSPGVGNGRSVASLGIVAHELGHVMRDVTPRPPASTLRPCSGCPHRFLVGSHCLLYRFLAVELYRFDNHRLGGSVSLCWNGHLFPDYAAGGIQRQQPGAATAQHLPIGRWARAKRDQEGARCSSPDLCCSPCPVALDLVVLCVYTEQAFRGETSCR